MARDLKLLFYQRNGAVLAPGVGSELMLITEGWTPVYEAMDNRPDLFQVMHERCDACLFTTDRIVPGSRAVEIINGCRTKGTHFICHKATLDGGKNVCCREMYDRLPTVPVVQLAKVLNVVKFVRPSKEAQK
jgi:hypothetical protein